MIHLRFRKLNVSSQLQQCALFSHLFADALAPLLVLTLITVITSCGAGGSSANALTAEEQFARAQKLYKRKKYFESAEEFQKVVYNYPGANIIDTAQFYLAKSYLEDEQYELAAVEFERLVKNYPRSDFAPDSRFLAGYARYLAAPKHYGLDQTELRNAIRMMEDFVVDYPDSRMVPKAKEALNEAYTRLAKKVFKSAMVYVHMGAYESALIYFQRVLDEHPGTAFAPLALLEMGKVQFKMNELTKAATTLNTFLAKYPDHVRAREAQKELKKVESKLAKEAPATAESSHAPNDSLTVSGADSANSEMASESATSH